MQTAEQAVNDPNSTVTPFGHRPRIAAIAKAIVSRAEANGWKGKKRDDLCFELFLGAWIGADACGQEKFAAHLGSIAGMVLCVRGYSYMVEMSNWADEAHA